MYNRKLDISDKRILGYVIRYLFLGVDFIILFVSQMRELQLVSFLIYTDRGLGKEVDDGR